MYLPDHFEEARAEELLRTIAAHPLGSLIVNGPHGLDADKDERDRVAAAEELRKRGDHEISGAMLGVPDGDS